MPQQRLEIGKNGNACTLRLLSLKYPRLTRQTVSDSKKAYLESKRNGIDVNSEGIVTKNCSDFATCFINMINHQASDYDEVRVIFDR